MAHYQMGVTRHKAASQLNLTAWKVLQTGGTGLPTLAEHILHCLGTNRPMRIGIDAATVPLSVYRSISAKLGSHTLVPLPSNPVDRVWEDLALRPSRPVSPSFVHPPCYAGISVEHKLQDLRAALTAIAAATPAAAAKAAEEIIKNVRHG